MSVLQKETILVLAFVFLCSFRSSGYVKGSENAMKNSQKGKVSKGAMQSIYVRGSNLRMSTALSGLMTSSLVHLFLHGARWSWLGSGQFTVVKRKSGFDVIASFYTLRSFRDEDVVSLGRALLRFWLVNDM